ncbi:MAG: serpin family protein [Bacteroidales bacterium]|nr:serpin family protein [Bacteroidales bacterium]
MAGYSSNEPRKTLNLSTKSAEFLRTGTTFSYDFLSRINAEKKTDYVISPLSMQFLLGMILDGAKGETAEQICNVLGYGDGEEAEVNEFCLSMLQQLPDLDYLTKLSLANAIYVDNGFHLLDEYCKTVETYYNAGVGNLDFNDRKGSADIINAWCSKNTNGLIPKVLDEVTPDNLAYLLNALYFKSQWSSPFKKQYTCKEDFTDEKGVKSRVDMMKKEGMYKYSHNDVCEVLELPYGKGSFAMTILLPKEGHNVAEVIEALKADRSIAWPERRQDVDIWLPKFETKFKMKMNDILSEMGMPLAFDKNKADFTRMSEYALALSYVRQDAIIKVDEEGTEAAAVSSAGMIKATAIPSEPLVIFFRADHPFLYLITETSTGAVLFAGRYSNLPSKEE